MYCPSCGSYVPDGADYCENCGRSLNILPKNNPEGTVNGYMVDSYINYWKKYLDFSSRTSRREFWYCVLADFIVTFVLACLDFLIYCVILILTGKGLNLDILLSIYNIATFIPGIAMFFRRMHDINKSGFNILWYFVPIVGWIYILILLCRKGTNGTNNYGPL